MRKSKAYTALLPWPGAWNIHNTIDKSVSQRKRKLISQWLSEDRLKRFESIIVRESGAFVNKFRDSRDSSDDWSKPVNVSDCCMYLLCASGRKLLNGFLGRFLIFDIMSECCFGKSFNLQTNPANRYLVHFANPLHRFNSAFVQSLDLMKYHLEKLFYPQGLWYAWKISKLARGMYTEQQSDKAGESLLSLLCQVEDPDTGKRMDMTEIWSELRFFMVTGAGSPASALASILFYLMRNVNCYHRLVKEIRSTFSAVSEIYSGSKMASCYYLHACITESLRMSPPVGGILWREVEEGGINIDGEYVSQGYDVGTGIYAVHHNEADFPSPFMFKPERWLQDETENSVGTESKAFLTFSTGPRQCMGRSFSMMILCDVIALLLWQLDLRRPAGGQDDVGGDGEGTVDENEFQQKDHIVSFFDGPCIEFRKRLF